MFEFYLPIEIFFGRGSVNKVGEVARRFGLSAIVITGKSSARKSGALEKVVDSLKKHGVKDVFVYEGVEPNPTNTQVDEISRIVVERKIDLIVGLGGGSSLDTAKAVSIVSSNEGSAWDYVNYPEGPRLLPYLNRPTICIPTTSGTGSEVNRYSVISNPIRKEKLVISHSLCYPKAAIVDPELTITMSPRLTATTGIDAFVHALESLTNKMHNPLADEFAIRALKIIKEWLPIAYREPENIQAREMMSYASMLAGIAIDKKRVALIHAMEHPVSAHYPSVAHGDGLAALALAVTKFNYQGNPRKYEIFAEVMGEDPKPHKAVDAVEKMLKSVDMLISLRDLGVEKEKLERLTEDVYMLARNTFSINPVEPSYEDLLKLYEEAF